MFARSVRSMDDWLRRVDVQGILGKSPSAVTRMIDAGILRPYYRPADPRIPLFKRSEVEALAVPTRRALTRT